MHSTTPRRLPAPLGRLLSRLPAGPGARLFASFLNTAVARHLPEDVRAALLRRRLRLAVTDAGLAFDVEWNGAAFMPSARGQVHELLIGASLHDFGLLAARKEDPDTLFFSRRLVMEGDTELGLLIKNTLDALDAPLFDPAWLAPRQVFQCRRRRPGSRRPV